MQGRFLFLGTGGSLGVPVVGCNCSVCLSISPYNKRMRSSGLIKIGEKSFLIDAGQEFRMIALKYGISHLTGALFTHAHHDHTAGFDDLRVYRFLQDKPLPCLFSQETFEEIKMRYHYLMREVEKDSMSSEHFSFHVLKEDFGQVIFEGLKIEYVSYYQMATKVMGFKVGNFAYVSDIRKYCPKVIETLQGIEFLVLSALRYDPSHMHFTVEEAIAFAREIKAKKTFLTHIAHDLDYELTNAALPSDIRMSYDGLEITFDIE